MMTASQAHQPSHCRGSGLPHARSGRRRCFVNVLLLIAASALCAPALAQTISTVAGNGSGQGVVDGRPATEVGLGNPVDVASARDGGFVIADLFRVRRVSAAGTIITVAGNGEQVDDGQNRPALTAGMDPRAIALDDAGAIYIADGVNNRIRKIGTDGIIRTIAGTGQAGLSGDGGRAIDARVNFPQGVAVAPDGSVLFSDSFNNRVRRIGIDGVISTVAGSGNPDDAGDGIPAVQASLAVPKGLAVGLDGAIYIADSGHDRIRRVATDGTIITVVGGGPYDSDPVATRVRLSSPTDVDVDSAGNLYVIDQFAPQAVRVQPDGRITPYAGAFYGFGGDGGNAIDALFDQAERVAVAADGSTLIADVGNRRIRKVTPVPASPPLVLADAFLPYTSIVVPSPIRSVVIGDVTGDRRADVVLSTTSQDFNGGRDGDTSVFVLRQQADGRLAAPIGARFDAVEPYAPGGLLLVDLNKDGTDDIVVGRQTGLTVFRGGANVRGGALHGVLVDSTTPSRFATRLVAVDADRDGRPDVAALGSGITLYYGNGRGGFSRQSFLAVPGEFGVEMAVGDVTGDTVEDLVLVSNQNGQSVLLVYPGAYGGGFGPLQSYLLVGDLRSISGLTIADFDGDGRSDVALSSNLPGNPGAIFILRQGDGVLGPAIRVDAYEYPVLLLATDLDRDMRADLLVLHPSYGVGFARQQHDGTFDEEIKYPIAVSSSASDARIAIGDIDGDGCDDVVTSNPQRLNVLRSAGCGGASDLALEFDARVPVTGTVRNTFRLVNRGRQTIRMPLLSATLSVDSGTVAVGTLSNGCAVRSTQPTRIDVDCLMSDIASGEAKDIVITATTSGGGLRAALTIDAEALSDTTDPEPSNNRIHRRIDVRALPVPTGPRPPRSPHLGRLR